VKSEWLRAPGALDRDQPFAELGGATNYPVVDKKVEDGSYADGILIALDSLPDKKDLGIRARLMSWEESALYPLDRA
jgi:hypothetical protein